MNLGLFGLKPQQIGDLVAICRSFAAGYSAFLRLDQATRSEVEELVSAATEDELDRHEKESIFGTLALMLFPKLCRVLDDPGLGELCDTASREAEIANRELDQEEATFAARLQETMTATGITQAVLAASIGVRQPAISMMLARTCRPQRRTVENSLRLWAFRRTRFGRACVRNPLAPVGIGWLLQSLTVPPSMPNPCPPPTCQARRPSKASITIAWAM